MSDNELDNLFKEAAQGFKAPNDPSAWKDMSDRLDQTGIGTAGFWNWKTISTIALVGVTGVALFWYSSQSVTEQSLQEATSQVTQKDLVVAQSNSMEAETEAKTGVEGKPSEVLGSIESEKTKSINQSATQPGQNDEADIFSKTEINNAQVNGRDNLKASGSDVLRGIDSNKKENIAEKANHTDKQPTNEKAIASSSSISQRVFASETGTKTNPGTQISVLNRPTDKQVESLSSVDLTEAESVNNNSVKSNITDQKTIVNDVKVESVNTDQKVLLTREEIKKDRAVAGDENLSMLTSDSLAKPIDSLNAKSEDAHEKELLDEEPKEQEGIKKTSSIAIKLAVAPDFSSINFFTAGDPGFNYGLMLGYSFNNRWSIYTGAISSRKIYSSDEIDKPYTSSGGYNYEVKRLDGDCRVLDIPINVYYTFFPDKSFSIRAGVGISSYFMISEDYTYYVDNQYGGPPEYNQNIDRKNNEWFRVMNISVILQKRLNNQFSLELEPFLKAPLTGVGEGEVSLVSLGAFLNLRFDIPIKKQ